ncbi:MAG: hypothetical protein ACKODS_01065 [Methylophilaceae bacterium]
MNIEYFAPCFESMNTREIQNWLHHAQIHLNIATGHGRKMTMLAISAAATELLFRWKHSM